MIQLISEYRLHRLPFVVLALIGLAGVFLPSLAEAQNRNDGHALFDAVLRDHVDDGAVDYPAVAADTRFADYLEQLRKTDAQSLPRAQKLAFWINAYNALAMKGILDGSSPRSFFGKAKFFYTDKYEAGGVKTNLYDLEHDILLPLNDARIHFAIVCASRSCPKLRAQAYSAERLDQQLDASARDFINDATRNRYDRAQKTAYLSAIFDWFEGDFERAAGGVQKFVARYLNDEHIAQELDSESYRVEHLDYDWNLNGKPPEKR
ncbi:MAG: DUF547 domain-containing protein [Burkholderiales bacterium]